jgi:hypothetical protein
MQQDGGQSGDEADDEDEGQGHEGMLPERQSDARRQHTGMVNVQRFSPPLEAGRLVP